MDLEKEIAKGVAFGIGLMTGRHNLDVPEEWIKTKAYEYAQNQVEACGISSVVDSEAELKCYNCGKSDYHGNFEIGYKCKSCGTTWQ